MTVELPLRTTSRKLLSRIEEIRLEAGSRSARDRQSELGQFFTPASVAALMARTSNLQLTHARLLDPGAGVGILAAAWIAHVCEQPAPPKQIAVTLYELDQDLLPFLHRTMDLCHELCVGADIEFTFEIRNEDFILAASRALNHGLFSTSQPEFDAVILNPPYKKLASDSTERRLLRESGIETSNLYTAFVGLALRCLKAGGELIAITPRSFCNGPYFTPFRKDLLRLASLTHLHLFDSRSTAFGGDDVLQENIVFRAVRGAPQVPELSVEWSQGGTDDASSRRAVPFEQVVHPTDADCFIHIAPDEWGGRVAELLGRLEGRLEALGLQVSTGRVVDFRVKSFLRAEPDSGTIPLIYPTHLKDGAVVWPKDGSKKPNAIVNDPSITEQFNPTGVYVLVKRFSSKEERRRIVAAVFTPDAAAGEFVAFENHLNYIHRRGRSVPVRQARGLAAYLNSTLVDSYFRQFNGHTQVNATDLRKLPYPTLEQLERMADRVPAELPPQAELDEIVESELFDVTKPPKGSAACERRIAEQYS